MNAKVNVFIRFIIGSWLLITGLLKILDLDFFIFVISEQNLLPVEFNAIFALLLCFFEIIVGISLIFGILEILVDIIVTAMFFSFLIFHLLLLKNGNESCGCYGSFLDNLISNEMSLFIALLCMVLSLYLTVIDLKKNRFVHNK
jgi:uncharacterized membrane protein YphA (DoxX/SURF4 family)